MSAPAPTPRFDLHLGGGEVGLTLASPLELAEGASLDELEVALGRFEGRMDLRAGAERFRHRRSVLQSLRIRVSFRRLEAWAASAGVAIRLSMRGDGGLGVRLEERALSPGVDFEGGALILRPREALTDGSGRAARALGFASTSEGALRLERPLRSLLVEALASRGWRVPDERGCALDGEIDKNAVYLSLRRPA